MLLGRAVFGLPLFLSLKVTVTDNNNEFLQPINFVHSYTALSC